MLQTFKTGLVSPPLPYQQRKGVHVPVNADSVPLRMPFIRSLKNLKGHSLFPKSLRESQPTQTCPNNEYMRFLRDSHFLVILIRC